MRRLFATDPDFDRQLDALLAWESVSDPAVARTVDEILAAVRARGDAALLEYTARLDGWMPPDAEALEIAPQRLAAALEAIPAPQRTALNTACARIRAHAERQCLTSWIDQDADGTRIGQQVTPLDRVGLYVPGGKAAYPSSVLMNAVPAKVAGVAELIMVVPTPGGQVNELVLAAARLAGVDRAFAIGGAQAVAALAYGTASVPAVDKIVGPGNIYVATAKRAVFGQVGIDMVAGPSEILILCDGGTDPDWIAMDLFSQAEHDEDAQAILIAWDAAYLDRVAASIDRLLPTMERRATIAAALAARGALILAPDQEAALALANRIAPEHLELSLANPEALAARIRHAGAIFLGRHTAEALGDYCAGPNHVLPTSRTARFSSPLGVYDFQKRSSLIQVSPTGAAALAHTAATLARGEGLTAHARSAEYRATADPTDDNPDDNPDVVLARLARPEIRALRAYVVPDVKAPIKLDAMENPYPLPESLRAAWAETVRDAPLHRYPDPRATAVQAALRVAMGIPDSAGLLLGNGSDELIQMLALTFGGAGRTLLSCEPGFAMYRLIAQVAGLHYVGVPLKADDFALDGEAMLEAIARHRPVLTLLAYPNNPTGNLFDATLIARLLDASPGLVVIDEAYAPFANASFLSRLHDWPNLLILRTVSKLGLAGLRLGYLIGPRAVLAEIDKTRLPYNINVLTQLAAAFALRHRAIFDAQCAQIRAERTRLATALTELGLTVYPSAANFLLTRWPAGSGERVFAALQTHGILVKNLHGAHPLLADCLRLTIGTEAENAALLAALAEQPIC